MRSPQRRRARMREESGEYPQQYHSGLPDTIFESQKNTRSVSGTSYTKTPVHLRHRMIHILHVVVLFDPLEQFFHIRNLVVRQIFGHLRDVFKTG